MILIEGAGLLVRIAGRSGLGFRSRYICVGGSILKIRKIMRSKSLYSVNVSLVCRNCELNFPRKIHLYQFEQQKQEVANWLHSIQVARWIWQLTLKWWLRHSPKAKVFGLLFWEIFEPTLKQNIRLGQQHQWQYSTPSSQQRPNWKTFELMVLTRSPTKT